MYLLQLEPRTKQHPANRGHKFKRDVQALVLHDFVAIQPGQLTIKKVCRHLCLEDIKILVYIFI